MQKRLDHICFILAMQAEANGIIKHYHLKSQEDGLNKKIPFRLFQNTYRGLTLSLITHGKDPISGIDNIGTQAAALSTYIAISELKPDLLINTGTAGGFKDKGHRIGEVVLAQGHAYFHDRRIPIPSFKDYAMGAYPLNDYGEMIADLQLTTGIISTGNAFDFNEDDLQKMRGFNASIKDMEAASVAWVSNLLDMPLMILKGVTDYVISEVKSEDEFLENFHTTVENITLTSIKILDYLIDKHRGDTNHMGN